MAPPQADFHQCNSALATLASGPYRHAGLLAGPIEVPSGSTVGGRWPIQPMHRSEAKDLATKTFLVTQLPFPPLLKPLASTATTVVGAPTEGVSVMNGRLSRRPRLVRCRPARPSGDACR